MSHIQVELHGVALDNARAAMAAMTPEQRLTATLARLNSDLAFLLRPLLPAIRQLPSHPPMMLRFKQDVVNRPVDALLDLFSPIESLAADTINEATTWSKKPTRVVTRPGIPQVVAPMFVDQPGDASADATTRAFVRRLRIVNNFAILVVFDPVALSVGLAKALFSRGVWVKSQLDDFFAKLPSPGKVAQEAADAARRAQDAAQKAAEAARLGTQTAADQAVASAQAGAAEGMRRLGLAGPGLGAVPVVLALPGVPAGVTAVISVCLAVGTVVIPPMTAVLVALIAAFAADRRDQRQGERMEERLERQGQQLPPGTLPPPASDSTGIPVPLLLLGAGLALMALKK
jgi:hypothetical protein